MCKYVIDFYFYKYNFLKHCLLNINENKKNKKNYWDLIQL